ncbi:MAG: proton-conducting transporter membrane subunit, partial [Chloroflexota bacterium]
LGRVRGVLQAAPLTGLLLLAGALALVGTPPFNIFLSKFTIIAAGMSAGGAAGMSAGGAAGASAGAAWMPWLMVLLLLGLAVAFAAFVRAAGGAVFGEAPQDVPQGEPGWAGLLPVAALLLLALVLGVYIPPQVGQLLNGAAQVALQGQPPGQAAVLWWSGAVPVGLLQARMLLP